MQLKSDPHIFSGMQRDMSISKHKPESLYDAKNLRFTARDGDTMLSITNERGTIHFPDFTMHGNYLGHCVLDDYIIVFTNSQEKDNGTENGRYVYVDRIYKIIPELPYGSTEQQFQELYKGNLKFSGHIETLGVYENDNIQKVYWTDGVNQPRYIVCSPYGINKIRQNDDTQFDFVPTLSLNEEINVERKEGSGYFAPGTIQYAFTYYNKYGRQSNIFYTTLLYYISYPDRGGSPEDKISTCFQIDVNNLQTADFDYLRVYSIHRTSENAVPTVKRIIDIELSTVSNNHAVFTDDGEIGSIVDPTELLYMGGELISAQTMTQKDNTLFFGNLNLERKAIKQELKDYLSIIDKTDLSQKPTADWGVIYEEYLQPYNLKKYDSPNGYYNYISTLDWSSPGFKIREHYRLGVQFQHKTGKWSEPVFIGDCTVDGIASDNSQVSPSITQDGDGNYILNEPCLKLTLKLDSTFTEGGITTKWSEWLTNQGYKKVRPVVVFPTISDRLVLTQGMLCPTVFSEAGRKNKTPFSQSSWFLRPNILGSYPALTNFGYNSLGNFAEYRHFEPISNTGSTISRANEIQGSENTDSSAESKHFYVDQSVVTMHSPDIEWDNSFYTLDYTHWKLNIVGAIQFTASIGAIDIQTSTPSQGDTEGFINRTFGTLNRSKEAGRSLISGLFWQDGMIKHIPSGSEEGKYEPIYVYAKDSNNDTTKKRVVPTYFMVYPWQRSGSLNNDEVRGDSGTRGAVLKQKKLSNLKFSDFNIFLNPSKIKHYDISPIQLFESDQVSLLKIPFNDPQSSLGNVSYYGNVDTLLNGKTNFYTAQSFEADTVSKLDNQLSINARFPAPIGDVTIAVENNIIDEGSAPVRMKYKSTKHLVFSLTSNNDRNTICLPVLNNTYNATGDIEKEDAFWLADESPVLKDFLNIDYTCSGNPNGDTEFTAPTNKFMDIGMLILDTDNSKIYICSKVKEASPGLGQTSAEISTRNEFALFDTQDKYFVLYNGSAVYYKGAVPYQGGNVEVMTAEEVENVDSDPFHIIQDKIDENCEYPYLLLGELYREDTPDLNAFSGLSDDAIKSNLWIPAGKAVNISDRPIVEFTQGDTWYTRYDCLKTYPFTQEDENQIVEIGSFLCESRINGDGRYDRNRGQISNLNMSPVNFNLLNPVYNNHDNFFNYRVLDEDYYKLNSFSNQITWSKEKQNAADIDLWTNVTMANTFDLDGTMGPINALRTWKDTIYCFQDNAISIISFNPRVQIPTSDGVPIEISNSYKLEGKVYISDSIGCENKQTIAITPSGIYFVDPNSKELYNLAGNQLTSVSGAHGFSNWFKSNAIDKVFYDKNRNDLYILNAIDCIVYSEILGQFTSFMDYNNASAMFNINDHFFAFKNKFVNMAIVPHKEEMFELGVGLYNDFFGTWQKDINQEDIYVPEYKPYWFEFISNQDSSIDKIFSTIDTRLDFIQYGEEEPLVLHTKFFDTIQVSNEYQDTGVVTTDAIKKFRIWRTQIPRDKTKTLDRIRNTWAKIRFTKTKDLDNVKMELHDLSVQYFI